MSKPAKYTIIFGAFLFGFLAIYLYEPTKPTFDGGKVQTLKAPTERIVGQKEIDWIVPDENGFPKNKGRIMSYAYIEDEYPAQELNGLQEDLSRKTQKSLHFKKDDGGYFHVVYWRNKFYKTDGKWYEPKIATTSIEAFEEQTKVSWLNRIFGRKVLAATYDYTAATSKQLRDWQTTWDAVHDSTTAQAVTALGPNAVNNNHCSKFAANDWYVDRSDFQFDTSGIGAGQQVDSATMSLWAVDTTEVDTDGYDVVLLNNTDNTNIENPVIAEDFNDFGTTSIGSRTLADFIDVGGNVAITLSNYDAIDMEGTTRIGMRLSGDISDTAPTGSNFFQLGTGTSGDDPFLTIETSAVSGEAGGEEIRMIFE